MIYAIEPDQFKSVRPLFEGVHLGLVIDAVVAGNSPAQIWGDNPANPRTALMWDKAHCYYLAGSADNEKFNRAAKKLVAERLAPEALARRLNVFKVYHSSDDWESRIETIFEHTSFRKMERVFYTFDRLKLSEGKDRIPPGFRVAPINQQILARTDLKNILAVTDEIESCWNSIGDFLKNGFGFCALDGDTVVCWCTAEYVSSGKCGIGIETIQEYERRGLATITARAFAAYCVSHHIAPHWDSWKANAPSLAVAEKVGFKQAIEYTARLGKFNCD